MQVDDICLAEFAQSGNVSARIGYVDVEEILA